MVMPNVRSALARATWRRNRWYPPACPSTSASSSPPCRGLPLQCTFRASSHSSCLRPAVRCDGEGARVVVPPDCWEDLLSSTPEVRSPVSLCLGELVRPPQDFYSDDQVEHVDTKATSDAKPVSDVPSSLLDRISQVEQRVEQVAAKATSDAKALMKAIEDSVKDSVKQCCDGMQDLARQSTSVHSAFLEMMLGQLDVVKNDHKELELKVSRAVVIGCLVAKLTSSVEEMVCRADDAERVVAKLSSSVEVLVCRADDAKQEIALLRDARGAGPAPSCAPPFVQSLERRLDRLGDSFWQRMLQVGERISPIVSRIHALELASVDHPPAIAVPEHGQIVYIDGLKTDHFNRRFGTCAGFDSASGRVLVDFWHDLPTKKFLLQNITISSQCPRCNACMEGRTICGECEYGGLDGGLSRLPREASNSSSRTESACSRLNL